MADPPAVADTIIEHPVRAVLKFEACLAWPDGADTSAFKLETDVRLYRKADLQGLVAQCAADGRPVTWNDIEASGAEAVATARSDADTGYFYFAEQEEDEDIPWAEPSAWVRGYKRIESWPTGSDAQDFYLAVRGCAVVLPLWGATLSGGNPNQITTQPALLKDKYLIDTDRFGCVIEMRAFIRLVETNPALQWELEAAFSGSTGAMHTKGGAPYYRDVLDWRWTKTKNEVWPGETEKRGVGLPVIHVVPLTAFDPREGIDKTPDERWSHHPDVAPDMKASVRDMFNLPADKPQLLWGLNVDADGRPDREEMHPAAWIDLAGGGNANAPSRAKVLDTVVVRFFPTSLKPPSVTSLATLRSFAFNRTDAEQVPFGDAVCMTGVAEPKSRIKVWRDAGFPVISPIMPQYTQNVDAVLGEELYEPLKWMSGAAVVGDTALDCRLGRPHARGGKPGQATHNAYDWPANHDSWSPQIDQVRKLLHFHEGYFAVGGYGGAFGSSRSNPTGMHIGLDLYNFIRGGYRVTDDALRGEPSYAMARGVLGWRNSGVGGFAAKLRFYGGTQLRMLDHMHMAPAPMPGVAHLTTAGRFQCVWAGTVFGWSGSNGNASGPTVMSKHLHMYYYPTGANPKADVAQLFGTTPALQASPEQRNCMPWVEGKVVNSHDRSFKREHVKVIAFERGGGKESPLDTTNHRQTRIIAIAAPSESGAFEMYIPPGVSVRILATRAFCAAAAIGDDSDCTDDFTDVGPYAAAVANEAAGNDLGTLKPEFKQKVTGRVVSAAGAPQANKNVTITDTAASKIVGVVKSGADGTFEAKCPAGKISVKATGTAVTRDAVAVGTDRDAGDIT